MDCRSACSASEYESTACTATTNRVCTACTTCTAGVNYRTGACTAGNTACTACPTCTAGDYKSVACTTTSAGTCASCPSGYYCTSGAANFCPSDSNSPTGSSVITACTCNAGYYGTNGGSCTICPVGSYCPGGTSAVSCSSVITGSSSLGGATSTSSSSCICNPGYTGSNGGPCTVCQPGYVCPGNGNMAILCSVYRANSYSIGGATSSTTSACVCNAGYYGTVSCAICTTGSYCPGGTSKNLCPTNSNSPAGSLSSTSCVCIPGYYGDNGNTCSICTIGKFCIGGSTSSTCPSNSNSTAGASACSCNAGYYGPNGGPTCVSCNYFSYSLANASACTCSPGYAQDTPISCVPCSVGRYCILGSSTACPANSISPERSSTLSSCICNIGYSGPNGGLCSACPANSYNTLGGSNACTCNISYYGPSGGPCSACTTQSNGVYTGSGTTATNCPFSCNVGYYGPSVGPCVSCQALTNGVYNGSGTTSTNCPFKCNLGYMKSGTSCITGVVKSCSAGYETSVDYTTCDVCREGTYKNVTGTGYCSNCSAGTYRYNPIAICNNVQTSTTCTTPNCVLTCATGLVSRFGPYGDNENLVIFIAPIGALSIQVIFDAFYTEEGYDFFEMRACVSFSTCDTLIARISGQYAAGYNGGIVSSPNVFNTPILKVIWNSDYAVVKDGWAFHYSVQTTESALSATACIGCPISTYGTDVGAVTSYQCKICDLGKYSALLGLTTCTDCNAGKYGSAINTCTSCDIGKYTSTGGRTYCTLCPTGSYSAAGSTSCPLTPPSDSDYFSIMLGEAGMMKVTYPCFDLTLPGTCVTTPYSQIASSYAESAAVHPSGTYALIAGNRIDSIYKINLTSNVVSTFVGGNQTCSGCDGIGTSAGFYQPRIVMISNSGLYAYVLETLGCRVRMIDLSSLQVTTIAGSKSNCALDTDGALGINQFGHLYAGVISPDDSYLLIYHDDPTCKIRKLVLATGIVSTIGGGACAYPQNGIGTNARFNSIVQLLFDDSGNYVYMRRDLSALIMRMNIATNQFEIVYNDATTDTICGYIAGMGFLADNRYMFALCWDTQNAVIIDLSTQSPSYLATLSVNFNNYWTGEFGPLGLTVYKKKATTTVTLNNGIYTGPGIYTNTCPFQCNSGYFASGRSCSPISNVTLTNGVYTGPGINANNCPFQCNSGYTAYGKYCVIPVSCSAGYETSQNGSTCVACGSGKYKSDSGTSRCTDCSVNYYASSTGSKACVACTPCPSSDQFLMGCGGASAGVCYYCDSST